MTPAKRIALYAAHRCEICAEPKEHTEWLLCDAMNALLRTPTRCQPGMSPNMAR